MPVLDVLGQPMNLATRGKSGQPILFLHGLGPGALAWDLVVQGLPEHFRALMLELPGFGQSPRGSFDGDIDHAVTLLHRALHQANQSNKIPVVAHGYGGFVALSLAARFPGHVGHLILIGSSGYVRDVKQLWALYERIKAKGWNTTSANTWISSGLVETLADDHLTAVCEATAQVDPDLFTGCLQAMIGGVYLEAVRTITAPILVMRGAADPVVTQDDAALIVARASDATHLDIPDAGHWPHLEAPAECRAALVDFIRP